MADTPELRAADPALKLTYTVVNLPLGCLDPGCAKSVEVEVTWKEASQP